MNHSASKVVAVDTESKLQLFAEHADSMPGLIAVVVWGFAPSLAELPRKNGSVISVCAATPAPPPHRPHPDRSAPWTQPCWRRSPLT